MAIGETNDNKASVAEQRDNFVGFAFAAADILLKLDNAFRITYASGAIADMLNAAPDDLEGKNLLKVLAPHDRGYFKALMTGLKPGRRVNPKLFSVMTRDGQERRMLLSCFQMEGKDATYISLSDLRRMPRNPHNDEHFDPATRMMKRDQFISRVQEHIQQDGVVDGEKLTTVVIDGLENLKKAKGQAAVDAFLEKLAERLRAKSLTGDSVGLLGKGRIGVLHDAEWDDETIMREAAKISTELGAEAGQNIKVDAQTVDLSVQNISRDDAAKSVAYALRHFAKSSEKLTVTNIHQSATEFLKSTDKRLQEIGKTALARSFKLALQPVMKLESRVVDHYEALTRFEGYQSPAQMIAYEDRKDLLEDFDLMMIQRALNLLARKDKEEKWQPSISVNISAKSLESDIFNKQVSMLLLQFGVLQDMLSFEVGDLDKIRDQEKVAKVVQRLRLNENKVYLDRFGVKSKDLQTLQRIKPDGVKIRGEVVHRYLANPADRPTFSDFCKTMKKREIAVIAEAIETEQQLMDLIKMGVAYGQGELFGLPVVEVQQDTFGGKPGGIRSKTNNVW